jgi:hypothetical protein
MLLQIFVVLVIRLHRWFPSARILLVRAVGFWLASFALVLVAVSTLPFDWEPGVAIAQLVIVFAMVDFSRLILPRTIHHSHLMHDSVAQLAVVVPTR